MTKLQLHVQAKFAEDVCSLVSVMEEFDNPFEEKSADLIVLDAKEIAAPTAVETAGMKRLGQEQFLASFTKEHLVERTKPPDDVNHNNKLKVFCSLKLRSVSKGKQQIVSF